MAEKNNSGVNLPSVADQLVKKWRKSLGSDAEVALIRAGISAPKIEKEKSLVVITIFEMDTDELDLWEWKALLFYFSTGGMNSTGNEPQEIQASLDKIKSRVAVKIYISDTGTKLYKATDENRKEYRDYPVMFIEINRTSDDDFVSNQYFRVLAPKVSKNAMTEKQFREKVKPLAAKISTYYDYKPFKEILKNNYVTKRQQYEDLSSSFLKSKIKENLKSLNKLVDEAGGKIEDKLKIEDDTWGGSSTIYERNVRMREAYVEVISGLNFYDISEITSLLRDVKNLIPDCFGVGDYIIKGIDVIIDMITFCKDSFEWTKVKLMGMLNDFTDSSDVLIAYASGFWNGIVDAIVGIFDTIYLIVSIGIEMVFLPDIIDFSRELIDEILQLDINFNLDKLMMEVVEFTQTHRESIIDKIDSFTHKMGNPRILAYYFGYTVYTIVEMYLPPLKLSRAMSASGKIFGAMKKIVR